MSNVTDDELLESQEENEEDRHEYIEEVGDELEEKLGSDVEDEVAEESSRIYAAMAESLPDMEEHERTELLVSIDTFAHGLYERLTDENLDPRDAADWLDKTSRALKRNEFTAEKNIEVDKQLDMKQELEKLKNHWHDSRIKSILSAAGVGGSILGTELLKNYSEQLVHKIAMEIPTGYKLVEPLGWPVTPQEITAYVGDMMSKAHMMPIITHSQIPERLQKLQISEAGVVIAITAGVALTGYAAYEAYKAYKGRREAALKEKEIEAQSDKIEKHNARFEELEKIDERARNRQRSIEKQKAAERRKDKEESSKEKHIEVGSLHCPSCGAPVTMGMESCPNCQSGLRFREVIDSSEN